MDRMNTITKFGDNTSDFEVECPGTSCSSEIWRTDDGMDEHSHLLGGEGEREKDDEPKDKYKLVWLVFYMLGMTTLLPWNFFIAVNDYWNYKFRDVHQNATSHTKLQKEFTSYLAIASNIPNAIFVILNVFYGQRFSLNSRLIGSLSFMATLFVGVLIMTRIDSDAWQTWFLTSTLTMVVLLNICTAIYQGGLIGVAGKFPPNYMGGMMAGQALGGIFPALVNIAVIAVQVTPEKLGFYCFLIAFVFVVLSLVAYFIIQTTDFFRHHAGTESSRTNSRVEDIRRPPPRHRSMRRDQEESTINYHQLVSKCWRYLLSVLVIFFTTLSVFPSVIVLISSQYSSDPSNIWANIYFTPVTCFLLFNCGDYLGRILASWIKCPGPGRLGENVTLVLSLARIVFIPLFMLCNAAPSVRTIPVFFTTDADYYALMVMFSLSNGYLGNLCMMMAPKTSSVKEEQEKIASLMVAVLVMGIGLGSALSYPLVNVI